jgi:hypothetical protein
MSRLAICDWSFGDSSTFHMMFRNPGLYAAGFANAPVAMRKPVRSTAWN